MGKCLGKVVPASALTGASAAVQGVQPVRGKDAITAEENFSPDIRKITCGKTRNTTSSNSTPAQNNRETPHKNSQDAGGVKRLPLRPTSYFVEKRKIEETMAYSYRSCGQKPEPYAYSVGMYVYVPGRC